MSETIIKILLVMVVLLSGGGGPTCWEDEVRVVVYDDPYGAVGVGTLGCVPADSLPVTGYRP